MRFVLFLLGRIFAATLGSSVALPATETPLGVDDSVALLQKREQLQWDLSSNESHRGELSPLSDLDFQAGFGYSDHIDALRDRDGLLAAYLREQFAFDEVTGALVDLNEARRQRSSNQTHQVLARKRARATGRTAGGWTHSYQAGKKGMTGSEMIHLEPHQGKLYGAVGYWMDTPRQDWGQVVRLDAPGGDWVTDLNVGCCHLRMELVKSVNFTTDASGALLPEPVSLLFAGAWSGLGGHDAPGAMAYASVWVRDDSTGKWHREVLAQGDSTKDVAKWNVRALDVHRDSVTGVDRVFVTIGKLGVFSGVYDASLPGKVRWDRQSETGELSTRPLALTRLNGQLYVSTGQNIYRRDDGLKPSWQLVQDLGLTYNGTLDPIVGGIRGLSVVPNPSGVGDSFLFVWSPNVLSHGCVHRLDPDGSGGFTRHEEVCVGPLAQEYLGKGARVVYNIANYNRAQPVVTPSGETVHLIGFQALLAGPSLFRHPTTQRSRLSGIPIGYWSGGGYVLRRGPGKEDYQVAEVGGSRKGGAFATKPELVAPRTFAVSPFLADREGAGAVYIGGYDTNWVHCSNTAWAFRGELPAVVMEPEGTARRF